MEIGSYQINSINAGNFKLDGGAMFGIIPKPLWEKTNPADEANRVNLATRCLLLQSGEKKILIDTGMGSKWDEKSQKIYAYNPNDDILKNELAKFGLAKDDITDVILSHLHFDHTGGSTVINNGKTEPAFPNAKYHVQKKNWEWAVNPTDRDKGSYIKDNFIPLMEHGVLNLIDGDVNFDDYIKFITVNGHTSHQQLIKISDGNNTLLYCCDLFPFESHLHLPYIMGYDLQPLVTLQEKKKILHSALEENWYLCFEHDPETAAATVTLTEKGYKSEKKLNEL